MSTGSVTARASSPANDSNVMTQEEAEAFEALLASRAGTRRRSSAADLRFAPLPDHLRKPTSQEPVRQAASIAFASLSALLEQASAYDRAPKKAATRDHRLYRVIPVCNDVKGQPIYPCTRSIIDNIAQGQTETSRVQYEHFWRLEESLPLSTESPRGGRVGVEEKPTLNDQTTGLQVAVAAAKGKRETMEDAHLITTLELGSNKVPCYGIFDGHASSVAATWLSEQTAPFLIHAIQERQKELSRPLDQMSDEEIENLLTQAIVALNEQMRQLNADEGAGSTLCLLLKMNGFIWCVNTGDTRALALRKEGQLLQLSEDADLTQDSFQASAIRRGANITSSECLGTRIDNELAIARALGDFKYKGITARPKVNKQKIEEDDTYFIGCDGIFETMTPAQLAEYFLQGKTQGIPFNDLITHLMRYPFLNGSGDNLTLMGITTIDPTTPSIQIAEAAHA